MKKSVEVMPEQAIFDEIAGRPAAHKSVIFIVPNPISEYLQIIENLRTA